jgi:SPP1 family predicted phage head-tail adaptor
MSLSSMLRNRIDVYGKVESTNALNEKEYNFGFLKSIWANIAPSSGNLQDGEVNTKYANISHKITIRKDAIPNFNNEMYFMFQGQRYDIEYYIPNYKLNDRIEIFCNLVVE